MTDEKNRLPTAAHEFSKIDHDEEEVWATNKFPPQMLGVSAIEQYELVRRKDVEKLIEDKIQQKTDNLDKLKSEKQNLLEELLKEVRNQ